MADLDARLILGQRPLPSVADMQDQRQQREIQGQEVELRRQEILARRDALREQARQRSMPPPVDEDKEFKLRLSKAKTLAQLLKGADADNYPVVRGIAQQLVGDDVLDDLPEEFDPVRVAALAKLGDEQIAKTVEQFTLSPGSKRFDASGKVIAEVPAAERAAAAQGFTLAPGGRRYDADGNLVASAPERPAGSGGAEPLQAIIGPDGKPVLVRRSQAEGKTPASSREQGRAVTSGDAGRIADLDASLNDLATLKKTIPAGTTGAAAKAGAMLPNFVTEATGIGADAKSKQAVIDRVKQVIGKALEGGVLRKEDEYKYEKILPTIGDVDSVVQAKLDGLAAALRQRRQTTLDSLEDAGYDTSRFAARQQAGQQPTGNSSVTVQAPNGKTYSFPNQAQADVFKKRAGIP